MARTLLAALAMAAALAGCSTGDPTTAAVDDTASAGTEDGVDVAIDTFAYAPATITVPAGTTVEWTNQDATRHTVTAGSEDDPDPDAFDLPVEEQGDVVEFTFDEPGTYAYYCVLHPFMEGTVEVTG